jgi:hypothetical protein
LLFLSLRSVAFEIPRNRGLVDGLGVRREGALIDSLGLQTQPAGVHWLGIQAQTIPKYRCLEGSTDRCWVARLDPSNQSLVASHFHSGRAVVPWLGIQAQTIPKYWPRLITTCSSVMSALSL